QELARFDARDLRVWPERRPELANVVDLDVGAHAAFLRSANELRQIQRQNAPADKSAAFGRPLSRFIQPQAQAGSSVRSSPSVPLLGLVNGCFFPPAIHPKKPP